GKRPSAPTMPIGRPIRSPSATALPDTRSERTTISTRYGLASRSRRAASRSAWMKRSMLRSDLPGVRREERAAVAACAVLDDQRLCFGAADPGVERLCGRLVRGARDEDHRVVVAEPRVAFDQDLEREAIAEEEVRPPVGQRVRARFRRDPQHLAHPLARFAVPARFRLDAGVTPERALARVGAAVVAARDEGRL